MGEDAEVRGDDIGDLRVAAGGLAVGQHDDRPARRGHLNRAEGNTVGDDVAVLDVFDQLAVKAAAHAVELRCKGVNAAEKGHSAKLGEGIVLRAEHDTQFILCARHELRRNVAHAEVLEVGLGRAESDDVVLLQLAALIAADLRFHVR